MSTIPSQPDINGIKIGDEIQRATRKITAGFCSAFLIRCPPTIATNRHKTTQTAKETMHINLTDIVGVNQEKISPSKARGI